MPLQVTSSRQHFSIILHLLHQNNNTFALQSLRSLDFFSNTIVVPVNSRAVYSCTLGNLTFICDLWMSFHVIHHGSFLFADAVWDRLSFGFDRSNLRFHLNDQFCQFGLALLLGLTINITGMLLAVGPHWGVASFPEAWSDFFEVAGAGLSLFALISLECRHGLGRGLNRWLLCFRLSYAPVNVGGGLPLHLLGCVGINIQRGG